MAAKGKPAAPAVAAVGQAATNVVPAMILLGTNIDRNFLSTHWNLWLETPPRDPFLQVLPEAAPVPVAAIPPPVPPPEPKPAPTEGGGILLKQKLDCALQLARTVSLDFNNALTIVLGHTSLLLGKAEPPTAVLCTTDRLAVGALLAINQAGFKPGVDVSVIGYDNLPVAEYTDPPLTTFEQPIDQAARHMVAMLLALIDGADPAPLKAVLPARLIVRQSDGPAPNHPNAGGLR